MARVRRRAAFSMIIMLIGFMAVVLVVVYRLVSMGDDVADQFALQEISLPSGAQIVSAQAQDGVLTITYTADGAQGIRIFDGETGELVREIAVVTE